MNILYISQVFPPDCGASVRALEQAQCLKALHHHVTVITTMGYYPLGKVHPKYKGRFYVREGIGGLDVIRVWSLPASNRGVVRRVLSQLSFAVSAFLVAWTLRKPDLAIASTHIFALELAVILLAKLRRSKAMIEFRDLLPDSLALTGVAKNSLQARFLRHYFHLCFRMADFVAVPSQTMVPHLLKRGVKQEKILLLPHAANREKFDNADPARVATRYQLSGKFVVVYAGSFSTYYDTPNILRAANIVSATDEDVHFLLIGDGQDMPRLKDLQQQAPNRNVTLTGHLPPEQIPAYLKAGNLCVTSLTGPVVPDFYRDYLTTKISEYLMAGKPILAVESAPVVGDFLRRIGAGESVDAKRPEDLAQAILHLRADSDKLDEYARNARRYADDHIDRMSVVAAFEAALVEKMTRTRSNHGPTANQQTGQV